MKKILLLIICVLLRLQISAQVAVTGHVVDDENKPLASVIIKRFSAQHKMRGYATSNHDGEFLINAEVGDSLTFSMLGFQEAHIAVKSKINFIVFGNLLRNRINVYIQFCNQLKKIS